MTELTVRGGYCDACGTRYFKPSNTYIFGGWICKKCLQNEIKKIDKKNKKKRTRNLCTICGDQSTYKKMKIFVDKQEIDVCLCLFCCNDNKVFLKKIGITM